MTRKYSSAVDSYLAWSYRDESDLAGVRSAILASDEYSEASDDYAVIDLLRRLMSKGYVYVVKWVEGECVGVEGSVSEVASVVEKMIREGSAEPEGGGGIWLRLTPLGHSESHRVVSGDAV